MADRRWWPTAAEIADDIRANLEAGDRSHALRMLMDGINRWPSADAAGRLEEVLGEPASVGDPRWDALLSGAVRYRLHQMGHKAPGWTLKQPLDKFWWPTAYSPSKAYNDLAHTPAELLRLGIFRDEREFTSEPDNEATEINLPGLTVTVASPEHLIAMKLRAMRERDMDDLETLFRHVGIRDAQQAADIHDRLFDDSYIGYFSPDEARYAAEQVFARARALGRPIWPDP